MEISLILPTLDEGENIEQLILRLKKTLVKLCSEYEIIVVDGGSKDSTREVAKKAGAIVIEQKSKGYGNALREGFNLAKGDYFITMDADLSHDPLFIEELWTNKDKAEIIIASRYVPGGSAEISNVRMILSMGLNKFFAAVLSIPFKDMSSGFRLYNSRALKKITFFGKDYNVLQEILIRGYSAGYKIIEIPFHYAARKKGKSKTSFLKLATSYPKSLLRLWKLRNSIESVDYDERAFNSKIPLQRFWQRKRHQIIMDFLTTKESIADIGCGSSRIIQDLPEAIAFDISHNKLKYIKKTNKFLVRGSIESLPFKDRVFRSIICSEVLEHVAEKETIFSEIRRILKDGGTLIVGTPDYSKTLWNVIELVYSAILKGGYAKEHITKYDYKKLKRLLEYNYFEVMDKKYILNSEMIILAKGV